MQIIILATIACIIGGINHNFYRKFFDTRIKNEVLIYLTWTISIIALVKMFMNFDNFYSRFISFLIINMVIVLLLYKKDYKKIFSINLTISLLSIDLINIIKYMYFILGIDFFKNIIGALSIFTLIFYFLLKLLLKFFKLNDKFFKEKNIITNIVLLSILIVLKICFLLNFTSFNREIFKISTLAILILIIISLLIVYSYFKVLDKLKREKDLSVVEYQKRVYKNYLKDFIYLKDYSDKEFLTGNKSISPILNYYKWKTNYLGIRFTYELKMPSDFNIDDLNLAIIIMNLMENSIDIIRNNDFSEKDKKIFLSVKFIGETLLIKIKSPYKNIKIRDDIKEDSVFDYTVFLNKVKSIVDNYESDIKVKTRDIIEIYVLIYLNNKNS